MNPLISLLLLFTQHLMTHEECKKPTIPPTYTERIALDPSGFGKLLIVRSTKNKPTIELALVMDVENEEIQSVKYAYFEDEKGRWLGVHLVSYEGPWLVRIHEIMREPDFDLKTFSLSKHITCQVPLYHGPR